METRLKRNDGQKRWFSTGFMSGGVGSVDAEKHTLHDAVLIRPGEALGHDLWIDSEFCADVAARGASAGEKGMKARFGHPNMCSEALGTFLGRWKNTRMDSDGRVVGDLFLSSTASESPKGDLRKYVEEMAAKEPQHFGASIVFTRNQDDEAAFMLANGATVDGEYLDLSSFKSPDPDNTKNLPHARCADLHAADLVDDPAATDGMFAGAGGLSLAAQMTEWLDTHPGVLKAINDEPELLNIVTRYAGELKPFLDRYTENLAKKPAPAAEPSPAPTTEAKTPAETDAPLEFKVDTLSALLDEAKVEQERLTGQLAGAVKRADELEGAVKAITIERDESAKLAKQSEEAKAKAESERDDAKRKLAAIEAGSAPLSATPAPVETLTPMEKARKAARI